MKPIFKPSDFSQFLESSVDINDAAMVANKKLNALIESWPVVYNCDNDLDWKTEPIIGGKSGREDITKKKARLAFIEELPKTECRHEPVANVHADSIPVFSSKAHCKYCGIELQATWSAK